MMRMLPFGMLLRRKGTASAIVALVLLVALVASVNCAINNLTFQAAAITKLVGVGSNFVVTDNTVGGFEGKIAFADAQKILDDGDFQYAAILRYVPVEVESSTGTYSVIAVGVSDLSDYYQLHPSTVKGRLSQNASEANIGILTTNLCHIQIGQNINIAANNASLIVTVVGVAEGFTQADTQILLPLSALETLTGSCYVSAVEFQVKNSQQASLSITKLEASLPSYMVLRSTQQVAEFARDVNNQTAVFVNVWSLAVYAVVAGASFVIITRLISDTEYELWMLKILGLKRRFVFGSVLVSIFVLGVVGSFLGVAVGVCGVQMSSTFIRWFFGSSFLVPFLEVNQAVWVFFFGLVAVFLGGLYPAVRGSYRSSEVPV